MTVETNGVYMVSENDIYFHQDVRTNYRVDLNRHLRKLTSKSSEKSQAASTTML